MTGRWSVSTPTWENNCVALWFRIWLFFGNTNSTTSFSILIWLKFNWAFEFAWFLRVYKASQNPSVQVFKSFYFHLIHFGKHLKILFGFAFYFGKINHQAESKAAHWFFHQITSGIWKQYLQTWPQPPGNYLIVQKPPLLSSYIRSRSMGQRLPPSNR